MRDLQRIHALIDRTRRRLRIQAALEWGTTASVVGIAGSLVVLWLWRMERIDSGEAHLALAGLGLGVLAAAVAGACRRLPIATVAARLDRASGLSDRLGTAVEFADRLRVGSTDDHPETRAMMEAAIEDARRAVDRANPKAAAPFRTPADTRAAGIFAVVAAAVTCLAFRPDDLPDLNFARLDDRTGERRGAAEEDPESKGMDPDDLDASRQYLADLNDIAQQTGDTHLQQFTQELEKLLGMAEKGEISKEELLAKMEELEKKYMEGADQDVEQMLGELKDMGKGLEKEPLTRRLGEALEAGDMDAAKKEMERLAEQLEKQELTPEQQKKLALALEKAAKKQEQAQKKQDEAAQKQVDKKKEEIRRLEKKLEQNPQDEQARRQLEKKKRELEELERDRKKREEQAQTRRLNRLSRDMKRGAENLRNKKPEQASRDMRDAADETRKIEDEIRKIENQKKAQSQLTDLKESIRRAKQRKGDGKGKGKGQGQAGRLARIREWERRAGGGQGNPGAWKGQGQEPGQGQEGQKGRQAGQGQKGQGGEQGPGIGDQHDPNLMGDPTKLSSKKREERLSGHEGRGPSRRETILTSAKKGFASSAYKRVYTDYKKIVEEVMNQEKVPQGYKYYVKRYFQRIKPHAMD